MTAGAALRGIGSRLAELSPLDLSLWLTLTLVLVRPGPADPWYLVGSTTLIAIIVLLVPELLRRRETWFLLAGLYFLSNNVIRYELCDNHKFLTSYWCLAIGLSLSMRDRAGALAVNGRVIVGFVFALATLQKLFSASYLSGEMFEQLLVLDDRFFSLSYLLGDGFTVEHSLRNTAQLENALRNSLPSVDLEGGDAVRGAALFLTWWTVTIEAALAILFLLPPRLRIASYRDHVLLAFVISTYPPTNVIQFGWLILAMGVAATEESQRRRRLIYIGAFLFIFIFSTGQIRQMLFDAARF